MPLPENLHDILLFSLWLLPLSMIEIIADCWKAVKVRVMGEGLLQGVSFPQLGS